MADPKLLLARAKADLSIPVVGAFTPENLMKPDFPLELVDYLRIPDRVTAAIAISCTRSTDLWARLMLQRLALTRTEEKRVNSFFLWAADKANTAPFEFQ